MMRVPGAQLRRSTVAPRVGRGARLGAVVPGHVDSGQRGQRGELRVGEIATGQHLALVTSSCAGFSRYGACPRERRRQVTKTRLPLPKLSSPEGNRLWRLERHQHHSQPHHVSRWQKNKASKQTKMGEGSNDPARSDVKSRASSVQGLESAASFKWTRVSSARG